MESSATAATQPDRMPADMKERGWKLERKVVNDDDENPDYVAYNEELGLHTDPYPVPFTAIEAARKLEGKPPKEIDLRPMATVPVERIRTDGETQPRDEIDQGVVDRYAEDMSAGAIFPLIVVFNDGRNYWLADGFHRLFAFKKANPESVYMGVDLRQGTQRDAILYSLGANATHGLPRSNEDKRRAAHRLLEDPEWSSWSDNVIAQKLLVSQPFVSSIRRELSQNVLSDAPPQPTARRGKDGHTRDTANIGRQPSPRVSPAETDIRVDSPPAPTRSSPPPTAAARPAIPDGWTKLPVVINLTIRPGSSPTRAISIAGRHGEGKPVFMSEFTVADLEPMPPAMEALISRLMKLYARRATTETTKAAKKKAPAKKR